jgi:hypothetical protein
MKRLSGYRGGDNLSYVARHKTPNLRIAPMRSQLLAARLALVLLVLGAVTALGAVAGVRLGLIAYRDALTVMVPATLLGVAALAAALVWTFMALKRNEGSGKRIGMAALAGALLFLYSPLTTAWARLTDLPIHDVTTNPEDPPRFVALAKLRRPGDNPLGFDGERRIHYRGEDATIAYLLHEYYRDLTKPVAKLMPGNPHPASTLFWRSFEAAKQMGWHIVDYSEQEGRIEATGASFWFGRIFDIVMRIEPSGIMGARVAIRIQSRSDRIDNGASIAQLKEVYGLVSR